MDELRENSIELIDINSSAGEESQTISVQIGSDYRDLLICSAPKILENELSATNTKFGWLISRRIPDTVQVNTCFESSVALACFHGEQTCLMWELEALGIKPDENNDVNYLVQKNFERNVTKNEEGSYLRICLLIDKKQKKD